MAGESLVWEPKAGGYQQYAPGETHQAQIQAVMRIHRCWWIDFLEITPECFLRSPPALISHQCVVTIRSSNGLSIPNIRFPQIHQSLGHPLGHPLDHPLGHLVALTIANHGSVRSGNRDALNTTIKPLIHKNNP